MPFSKDHDKQMGLIKLEGSETGSKQMSSSLLPPNVISESETPASEEKSMKKMIEENKDELFLLQFPKEVGVKKSDFNKRITEEKMKEESNLINFEIEDYVNDFSGLKAGRIGKLLFYKSGKVKMKIGDILMDVSQGINPTFHEEITCIDNENNSISFINQINKRVIVTPNITDLL